MPEYIVIPKDAPSELIVSAIQRLVEELGMRAEKADSGTARAVKHKSREFTKEGKTRRTFEYRLENATQEFRDLYEATKAACMEVGEDIKDTRVDFYEGFWTKRGNRASGRIFASIHLRHGREKLFLILPLITPKSVDLKENFLEIVGRRKDKLKVIITKPQDIKDAKPYIRDAYEAAKKKT